MSQFRRTEIIRMLGKCNLLLGLDCRFSISYHSFSRFTFRAYHRPILFPFHRIQHHTSTHIIPVLESIGPRFTFKCLHISALMYTGISIVDIIINKDLCFIRTVKITGAADHLYPIVSQCRIEYIIPAIPFISVTSFKKIFISLGSCYNQGTLIVRIQYTGSIIFQTCQVYFRLSMCDIFLTIIINEKSRIIQTLVKLMH